MRNRQLTISEDLQLVQAIPVFGTAHGSRVETEREQDELGSRNFARKLYIELHEQRTAENRKSFKLEAIREGLPKPSPYLGEAETCSANPN